MADSYSTRRPLTETEERSIAIAVEFVRHSMSTYFEEMVRAMCPARKLESLIETAFWILWQAVDFVKGSKSELVLHLVPQQSVDISDGSSYRLDFSVYSVRDDKPIALKVAVELDGHEFHERTKEQVAYRNERDRKLLMDGWTVFHVSGSEMFHGGLSRALEVYEFCVKRAAEGVAGYQVDASERGTT